MPLCPAVSSTTAVHWHQCTAVHQCNGFSAAVQPLLWRPITNTTPAIMAKHIPRLNSSFPSVCASHFSLRQPLLSI